MSQDVENLTKSSKKEISYPSAWTNYIMDDERQMLL